MPHSHSSCWYSGGRCCCTGYLRDTVPWHGTRFLRWLLGTWAVLTSKHTRELWTRGARKEVCLAECPEQTSLLLSPDKDTHIPQPRAGSGDRSPAEMGQQNDREKTPRVWALLSITLERSCGSASTLSSVTCSCGRAVKSGPCSGQRQNIQSSPGWVLILVQIVELLTGTRK